MTKTGVRRARPIRRRVRPGRKAWLRGAAFVALGAVVVSFVVFAFAASFMNQKWHNGCEIRAKDVLYSHSSSTSSNGGSSSANTQTTRTLRLSTSCGSYRVGDTPAGGFNSWDTWSALEEGKSYDIRTGGFRVGILSMFPDVIEIREAK